MSDVPLQGRSDKTREIGGAKLTFCRNFQRTGTASRPFFCSTTCRKYSTEILCLQLHIFELWTTLFWGSWDRKAAGSPNTTLATGLELIRSSWLIRALTVRRVLSRSWVNKQIPDPGGQTLLQTDGDT